MPLGTSRNFANVVWVGLAVVAAMGAYLWATSLLQYRALYPGDLVFVGYREGMAIRYVRLFMWKPADYTDALPAMTIHFEDKSYALSEFSPDVAASLGGTLDTGALWDAEGWLFQYRFENGKLTYISLLHGMDLEPRGEKRAAGGNVRSTPFSISVNNGPRFALPVSHGELIEKAGKPNRISRQIPN